MALQPSSDRGKRSAPMAGTPRKRIVFRVKVLVVDNCSAVRERLLDLIRSSDGVDAVWQAADAAGALALARDQPLDAAIVDLALGRDSGLDLLRELRALRSLIVLTNSSTEAYREACRRRGAHFFFDKSHDFEQAIAVLRQLAPSNGGPA